MRLADIRTILTKTKPDDWSVIPGIPSFGRRGHHAAAVYREDVHLTVAWGMAQGEPDDPEATTWAPPWPDPKITSFNADVFYAGALVDRHVGAYVDGGRAILPYPISKGIGAGTEWEVGEFEVDFFWLISGLTGLREYDRYLDQIRTFPYD